VPWPKPEDRGSHGRLLAASHYHGVAPLIHRQLAVDPVWQAWPPVLRDAWAGAVYGEVVAEYLRRRELTLALASLAAVGVEPVLMKGSALAYTHYPAAYLRPCWDADMLVREADVEAVRGALAEGGYEQPNHVSGRLISYQATYLKRGLTGVGCALDVHWRINNNQLLAHLLDYGEVLPRAERLPALGVHALALGPQDALLLACIHRAAHVQAPYYLGDRAHDGSDRLIWLYDIHLLVSRMSSKELDQFVEAARRKRICTICREALERAQQRFGTLLPAGYLDAWSVDPRSEPSAACLTPRRLRGFRAQVRALPDWASRLRLLKEHIFPPGQYLLNKYRRTNRAWLPLLYARRGVGGVWKLLCGQR
jgi:hypothetical protein